MRKMRKLSVLFAVCLAGPGFGQAWEVIASLPTGGAAKVFAVGASTGGRIYALGGTPWTSGGDGTVYSMAIGGSLWTEELSFDGIGPVIGQGGAIDALGRILIFGGEDTDNPGQGGPTFDWDPNEGPWHEFAARGAAAPLRGFAFCADASGRVYSFGGGPGENASASSPNTAYAERYLPNTDTWQPIAPMPTPAGDAAAVEDGRGHILVIGGVSATGSVRLTEVQEYDVATGTWSTTAVPDLPTGVSGAGAVRGADGKIYLVGGRDGPIGAGSTRNEVLIYDPADGTWSPGPSMHTPRHHFAIALGSDDFIYVMGGDNDSGGTNAVERIHPTNCPVFNMHPGDQTLWRHSPLIIEAAVVGEGTLSLQWMHDGEPVANGPTPHGSTIAGADTQTLSISNVQPEDAGSYRLLASNGCGTTLSEPGVLTVRIPPELPTSWTVTNLHPAFADSSWAMDVDGDVQVGASVFETPEYGAIDHPTVWHGSAASARDATPPGSLGGAITAISGDSLVGWWWRPFPCYIDGQYYTCYYMRPCTWNRSGLHDPTDPGSGYEYGFMADTDGSWHVGSLSYDEDLGNYTTHAYVWRASNLAPLDLHPAGAANSGLAAIDGGHQYGWIHTPYPGPVQHAAMWSGSAATFVDLHPPGAARSAIAGAGDGQQVGTIDFYSDHKAALWSGSVASYLSLHPSGAGVSEALACRGGLQVGAVDGSAHLWASSADEGIDLGVYAGPNFTSTYAAAIDIAPDGSITVVGYGSNASTGRQEALMWRSVPSCGPADLVAPFGTLDFFDVAEFLALFSAHDPLADLNADGTWDFFDVSAYLSAFSAGCP